MSSYRQLLSLTGALATGHEVVVAVTVAHERLVRRSRRADSPGAELADAATTAADALVRALEIAGQHPSRPLDPTGVREVIHARVDPVAVRRRRRTGRLADRLRPATTVVPGPLIVETGWRHLRTDAAWHRTYWIAGWPQLALPPSWMEPLLAADGLTRSVTVALVPVGPDDARRRIRRDLVKLGTDATSKEDRGRRVDARHHRVTEAVLERERELASGHAEFAYIGLVTVSATSEDELDNDSELMEQVAREVSVELRCLDGRQDVAWAAALPIGLLPRALAE